MRVFLLAMLLAGAALLGVILYQTDLGEVAAGAVAGLVYVVGSGSSATFSYDLATRTWSSSRAVSAWTCLRTLRSRLIASCMRPT